MFEGGNRKKPKAGPLEKLKYIEDDEDDKDVNSKL